MKVLLDENLPHQLRHEIIGHDVYTTAFMNWSGVENGELLTVAATEGCEVLITTDRGLEYEQNLALLPIAVVVLLVERNTIESLRPLLTELHAVLSRLSPREFVKISS
jgi:predicted nuclease of predicted toxin-antitoxin system